MYQKIRSKLLFFIPTLILCFFFTACSGGQEKGGNDAIAGIWEMTQITAGNSQVSADDYMKSADVTRVPTLTFESNGNVTLEVDGDSGSGTWLEKGGQYTVTYKSGEEEVTKQVEMDNGTLTMEQDGYTLTYERK